MRTKIAGLLLLGACSGSRTAPSSAPRPSVGSVDSVAASDVVLGANAITQVSFARRTLWSWTKETSARALAEDGQGLARFAIRIAAPDRSFYDLHLRRSSDEAIAALLRAPPLDRIRFAWSNPWGAADGLEDEAYGDRLIEIVLRPEAIVVRFVPLTEGENDPPDAENPLRQALPEWSFFDLAGRELPRADALSQRDRWAVVFHVVPHRDPALHRFLAYREFVLCNDRMIERWSLGTASVRAALSSSRALVRDLVARHAVPVGRADDDAFLLRHFLSRGTMREGFETLSIEERWLLTLPFPRAHYRDLPHLLDVLDRASEVQTLTATRP